MALNTFDDVWPRIEPVGGWLTRDQARVLHDAVLDLPPGSTVVEIGSHQGRSTLALALARPDVTVVAIDPFRAGGMFGGPATRAVFEDNLRRAEVRDRVDHVGEPSGDVRRGWRRPVDLVFVDGKHDVWSTRDRPGVGGAAPAGAAGPGARQLLLDRGHPGLAAVRAAVAPV